MMTIRCFGFLYLLTLTAQGQGLYDQVAPKALALEDAVLAEELLARKKLSQDIAGRLSDCVLLIRSGRVEAVIDELQKMGHTPQVLQ